MTSKGANRKVSQNLDIRVSARLLQSQSRAKRHFARLQQTSPGEHCQVFFRELSDKIVDFLTTLLS